MTNGEEIKNKSCEPRRGLLLPPLSSSSLPPLSILPSAPPPSISSLDGRQDGYRESGKNAHPLRFYLRIVVVVFFSVSCVHRLCAREVLGCVCVVFSGWSAGGMRVCIRLPVKRLRVGPHYENEPRKSTQNNTNQLVFVQELFHKNID